MESPYPQSRENMVVFCVSGQGGDDIIAILFEYHLKSVFVKIVIHSSANRAVHVNGPNTAVIVRDLCETHPVSANVIANGMPP